MQHTTTLPIHPRTGLRAVGIVAGKPVWPIKGGSGEGGEGGDGGDGGGKGSGTDTFTPPASQEDLDRILNKAVARAHAKYADYDDLKAKAEKHDALELELSSDKDKAVADARKEERAKALSEATPRIVRAEFKAAAKGVLTGEQLAALLEDLDLSKYVTDTGDVDEEKVGKKVAAFAPANGTGKQSPPRALGQGKQPGMQAQPGDAGRAMAEKRFGSKKP